MHWKMKAWQHKITALLPSDLSYSIAYALPRYAGRLRTLDPRPDLRGAVKLIGYIRSAGGQVEGSTFLEIGTGRRLNIPLALWLCGAQRILTVELNPYLKLEMVSEDIEFIRAHEAEIREIFGIEADASVFKERIARLVRGQWETQQILHELNIEYRVGDASRLNDVASHSIDHHISFAVLEHIPKPVMESILREGKRVLSPAGLFVHLIDMSDHFSHIDPGISAINFLQFEPPEWDFWANNRYHYHNRLRYPDYLESFRRAGLQIVSEVKLTDDRSLKRLQNGFNVATRFRAHSPEINAITTLQIVAKAACGNLLPK
jgi:SAM-dependent methyltransferase